jgi:hypothetical protein
MGCDEQNGVPDSMGKMQRHPLAQGLLTPQLPPQVARALGPFLNCRAETVPAHKTPMTSRAKKVDLIFFFMNAFLLRSKDRIFFRTDDSSYFAGLAAMKPHTPESGKLGWLKTHPQPRTLGQCCVLLQKWCWQVVS